MNKFYKWKPTTFQKSNCIYFWGQVWNDDDDFDSSMSIVNRCSWKCYLVGIAFSNTELSIIGYFFIGLAQLLLTRLFKPTLKAGTFCQNLLYNQLKTAWSFLAVQAAAEYKIGEPGILSQGFFFPREINKVTHKHLDSENANKFGDIFKGMKNCSRWNFQKSSRALFTGNLIFLKLLIYWEKCHIKIFTEFMTLEGIISV